MERRPNPAPDPIALRGHASDVQCAVFANATRPFVLETGDADGVVIAWDVSTRREIRRTRAHGAAAGVLTMVNVGKEGDGDDDFGRLRLTQGRDGTMKLWERGGRRERQSVTDKRDAESTKTRNAADDDDDDADDDDGDVELTDAAVRTGVHSFCRSASDGFGRIAYAGTAAGTIVVAKARTRDGVCTAPAIGNEDDELDPKVGMVMCVAFVGRNHALAGYEDGTVILWALDEETRVASVAWRRRAHEETALCVDVDTDARGAVTGGADGVIVRYDINVETSPVEVSIVRKHGPYASVVSASSKQPGVNALAIRSDGKIVACGCWDGKIRIFEYKVKSKGRLLAVLKYHESSVTDVAFAPDGSFLVSTARDGVAALWNVFPPNGLRQ